MNISLGFFMGSINFSRRAWNIQTKEKAAYCGLIKIFIGILRLLDLANTQTLANLSFDWTSPICCCYWFSNFSFYCYPYIFSLLLYISHKTKNTSSAAPYLMHIWPNRGKWKMLFLNYLIRKKYLAMLKWKIIGNKMSGWLPMSGQ